MQNARKTAYTFFVFYNWSTKKTKPTVFQNRTETEPNLKNPFRTSLVSMTLSDLKARFQGHDIIQCQITRKWYKTDL